MVATHNLTRLYDNHTEAVAVVRAFETAGFGHDDVGILSHAGHHTAPGNDVDPSHHGDVATGTAAGATVGSVVGGGLGLLAAIGAVTIPGLGQVLAAGWLITAVTGAGVGAALGGTAGGLAGALVGAGVNADDAHVYAEAVRRGGSLVTVRVDDARLAEAERLLDHSGAIDPAARRSLYEQYGWTHDG